MMRFRSLCSEVWRNIAAGTSNAIIYMFAVLLCALLAGCYDLADVISQEREAAARISSLADGMSLVGNQNIDGVSCDRLATVPNGPFAAGAMRKGDAVVPLAAPGKSLTNYQVSPGMIRLITGVNNRGNAQQSDVSGIWLPLELANTLAAVAGSDIPTDRGMMHVAGVFQWPNDGRDTRFGYAIIEPVSASGRFDECWARQWPRSSQTEQLLFSSMIVTTETGSSQSGMTMSAGTRTLNANFSQQYDALARYRQRATRWMPIITTAAGLLIGMISVRRRRLEYAAALHCGQRKADMLAGIGLETCIWAGVGATVAGCMLTVVAWRGAYDSAAIVAWSAVRAPLALFGSATAGAVLTGAAIRERYLFRYFKNR